MYYFFGTLFMMVAAVFLDEHTYCSLRYRRLCQGKGRHVACQFPLPGQAPSCRNYSQLDITRRLQNYITHDINRRRQRIAAGQERVWGGALLPKPQIMMLVRWDRELAYLAQRLADQCQFVHDDCRATVRYPYAGQSVGEVRLRRSNLYEEHGVQRILRRVLDAWWGERRRVRPAQLTVPFRLPAKGLSWGHFSQLAVWTLRAVGCGAVAHGDDFPRLLLVCDFSHTNMLGQMTIKPGPLKPCPIHTERRPRTAFSLLCTPVKPKKADNYIDDKEDHIIEDLNYDDEEYTTDASTLEGVDKNVVSLEITSRKDADYHEDRHTQAVPKFDLITEERRNQIDSNKHHDDTMEIDLDRRVATKKYHHVPENSRYMYTPSQPDEEFIEEKCTKIIRKPITTEKINQVVLIKNHQKSHEVLSNDQENEYERIDASTYNTKAVNRANIPAFENQHLPRWRPRWKQTRARPSRPGATALLRKNIKTSPRSPPASLNLDSEDLDQLFKDTGFTAKKRGKGK